MSKALFMLSSPQVDPLKTHVFVHVTSLTCRNAMTPYVKNFVRATAYMR